MKESKSGTEGAFLDAQDLSPDAFRRIVDRRARQIIDPYLAPSSDEDKRREREAEIDVFFEKIHRGEDFLPARFLRDGANRAEAVCRITTPRSLGTGFLIAPGILMTNNHVLKSEATAGRSFAEFGFEDGQNMIRVAIQPDNLFITDRALDFTIVACDTNGLDGIAPIPLLRNPATVTRNERVNVIQHPRGRRKEIAIHDNKVIRILDRVVRYRTDTEPGSSGSPVFNNEWDLVALHHAGVSEDDGSATNEGIRISAIVSHLLRRSGNESASRQESFRRILGEIADTSPFLGFFDILGTADPGALEVEVPDFTGTRDFADVGVWNIEHFNNTVSDQRIEDVADVTARLALDVLGLVEVEEGAMERLVTAMGQRGFSMGFELLNVGGRQDLAVLFDQETTTVRLRGDIAERHADRLNARTPSGRTAFPRHPLFAECTVSHQEEEVTFMLIVVHLKAFGDAQSRARRRLASEQLTAIIEDIREREDMPVVLGGDFNERIDTDVLSSLTTSPDLFAMTADDASNDAISFVGGRRRSLIDHILVSRDVQLGDIAGDDAAIVRLDRSIRDFSDRVSDHVPIVFRIVLRDEPVIIEPPASTEDVRASIPEGATVVHLRFEDA